MLRVLFHYCLVARRFVATFSEPIQSITAAAIFVSHGFAYSIAQLSTNNTQYAFSVNVTTLAGGCPLWRRGGEHSQAPIAWRLL